MDKFDFRIENQFEELVFGTVYKGRTAKLYNTISINYKKDKPYKFVFSTDISKDILKSGFRKLKVVRNKLTSEIFIVINKEVGLNICLKDDRVASVANRQFIEFIVKAFNISYEGDRHITISNNLSKTSDCLTYKLSDYK